MQRWLPVLVSMLLLTITGCGGGSFAVPKTEYRDRVKTLGVLPLMLDETSEIKHPDRDAIIKMLRHYNTLTQKALIDELIESKYYFDVRPVAGDPRQLFQQLVSSHSLAGKGDSLHRSYVLDPAVIASLTEKTATDALLVIILNGMERQEKRWDRTSLTFLRADYNVIVASAVVVAPDGQVLWEYHGKSGESFLPLQYPDFDEAYYNKTDEVKIRFISTPGLERTLAERTDGLFVKASWPVVYQKFYDQLISELNPGIINPLRNQKD